MTDPLEIQKLLHGIYLFKSLSDDNLENIMNAPENGIEEYDQHEFVVRESEVGDFMYIILDGYLRVSVNSYSSANAINVATLRSGDFFGEQSLLPSGTGRRNASVKTLVPTKIFRIHKKYVLISLKYSDKNIEDFDSESKTTINTGHDSEEVRDLIMDMRLFESLNDYELETINSWTEVVTFGPGDFVIKKFQKGEHLYVILDGEVEVFTLDHDGQIIILAKLSEGEFFGEQALMPDSNGKRNAFVKSNNKIRLIKIPKQYFRLILTRDKKIAKQLKKFRKKC